MNPIGPPPAGGTIQQISSSADEDGVRLLALCTDGSVWSLLLSHVDAGLDRRPARWELIVLPPSSNPLDVRLPYTNRPDR